MELLGLDPGRDLGQGLPAGSDYRLFCFCSLEARHSSCFSSLGELGTGWPVALEYAGLPLVSVPGLPR